MSQKVLIIEDEELISELLQKKLSNQDYEVEVAEDGKEGLETLREKENPDVVLLDIIMPKKGGFDVLEEMKDDEKLQDIPVIIVSNSGQPVELEKAKKLGAEDWIIKTEFDPQEVIEKVEKIIE